LIILSVTIISVGLNSTLGIINSYRNLKKEIIDNQELNAKLIAENCVTTLMFNDTEGASRILQTLNKIPNITFARIYDKDSLVFANLSGNNGNYDDDKLLIQNNIQTENDHIIFNEPIKYDNQQYGTLCMVVSTKFIQEKIFRYLVSDGIILIIVIILAIILATKFQKIVSSPILKLAQFAEKISGSSNYQLRIDKITNDETGILYDRFNSMLQRIEEHQLERDKAEQDLMLERESLKERTIELEQAKIKAEESDRLKSSFLANLSHEIRTPMNAIIGFANFLKMPETTAEERVEFIDIINSSGKQLLSIITDIIEISQIEVNLVVLKEEPVDIDVFIVNIFKELSLSKQINKGVDFKLTHSSPELLEKIITDETKLKQVITNLLTNAFKFTKEGFVEFGYKPVNNSFLEFFVKDSGIGIDKKLHKIIFERFRQAENELQFMHSGSGLGLAISKAYVEMMGGAIQLQSEPGKGSLFSFKIPYKTAENEKSVAPEIHIQKTNQFNHDVILVAEDNDWNFRLVQGIFSKEPVKIIRAFNGKEAVDICKNNPNVNLILMDIKMPEMDGHEATRQIKAFWPDLPIIALTAFALSGDKEQALESGCDAYISKPMKKDELFRLIQKVKSFDFQLKVN